MPSCQRTFEGGPPRGFCVVRSVCLALLATGCASEPPPLAPRPVPPEKVAPPTPPAPAVDPPVQACEQDAAAESPIATGTLGDGERLVRIENNSGDDVQARILNVDGQPALPGTLHIPRGTSGDFHVGEGTFVLRYRLKGSCVVRQGKELLLTGPRRGVEISIKPSVGKTSESGTKSVPDPL